MTTELVTMQLDPAKNRGWILEGAGWGQIVQPGDCIDVPLCKVATMQALGFIVLDLADDDQPEEEEAGQEEAGQEG